VASIRSTRMRVLKRSRHTRRIMAAPHASIRSTRMRVLKLSSEGGREGYRASFNKIDPNEGTETRGPRPRGSRPRGFNKIDPNEGTETIASAEILAASNPALQ